MSQPNGSAPDTVLAPHSVEAEEALLGSLLSDPEALVDVLGTVAADDFFIVRHGWLFETLVKMYEARESIDTISVADALRRAGKLDDIGGPAYLTRLLVNTSGSFYAAAYAQIVARAAMRRRLLRAASEIAQLAHEESADINEVIERAEGALFAATARREDDETYSFSEASQLDYDATATLYEAGGGLVGVPTGYLDLDALLGGLPPESLTFLAGRPGSGKTTALLNVAANVAAAGHVPLVASLEMGRAETIRRFKAAMSDVPTQKMASGRMTDEEWRAYTNATSQVADLPGFLYLPRGLTPLKLRTKLRRMIERHGVDILIVDYVQLMRGSRERYTSRQEEVSDISRALKELAREFRVPILAAAQLNREVESRADKRPLLSDLRESGSLEQDADVVIMLHRDDMYNEASERPNQADFIIAKNRNGPTGTATLFFRKSSTRFMNLKRQTAALNPPATPAPVDLGGTRG